jgi:hypothetical protein
MEEAHQGPLHRKIAKDANGNAYKQTEQDSHIAAPMAEKAPEVFDHAARRVRTQIDGI